MIAHRLETWHVSMRGHAGVLFRPGRHSWARRLIVMAVCLSVSLMLLYALSESPTPDAARVAQGLDALIHEAEEDAARLAESYVEAGLIQREEVEALRRDRAMERASTLDASRRLDRAFRAAFAALASLFAAVALLAPLSLSWECLRVYRDAFGRLVTRRRGFTGLSRSRSYPGGTFHEVFIRAREHMERPHRMGYRQAGWTWDVLLAGEEQLLFCVARMPFRPLETGRVPAGVQQCAEVLAAMVGCKLQPGFRVAEAQIRHAGPVQVGLRYIEHHAPEIVRESFSLEDAPEEVRRELAAALARGEPRRVERIHQTSLILLPNGAGFRCTFPDGTMRTFERIEDLPAELRALARRLGEHGFPR